MVKLGEVLKIEDELYEVVRKLKVRVGKTIPTEFIDDIKVVWHVDKVYKHGDTYYFVNEVTTVEPIYEQDSNTGEAN